MLYNYRTIEVEVEQDINGREIQFIRDLSFKYSPDIKFEVGKNKIIVRLIALDLASFKQSVQKFNERYELKEDESPFSKVVKKIEKIGSYGIKGRKRIFVGFDRERKVKNRKQKEEKRSKYYYARKNPFSKEENEFPEEYVDKIVIGDSEYVLKNIPNNSVDLVFTSPPYNFGLEYAQNQDDHFWEDYFSKLFGIFEECIRVVKYGGRIIINVQPLFSDYIPSHHLISNFFIKEKLIWKAEILWEKNNYNCKYTAWGSWKSPSNPYLKYTWEFIEVFCKGDLKKVGNKEDVDISGDEFKKWVVAKWSIAPERNMKDYGHPAMFPEELVERILKLFSYQGDIVLDPFNGVGTTTLVAKKLGRRYVGIDISEKYCKVAEERIGNLKCEMGLFANEI